MPSETASGGTLVVRGGELLGPEGFEGRADLLIVDGSITEVGQVGAVDGARELDASRCFVAPGLINAHYHSAENFNPGRYENLPLDLWFVHSHQVARKQPPTAEVRPPLSTSCSRLPRSRWRVWSRSSGPTAMRGCARRSCSASPTRASRTRFRSQIKSALPGVMSSSPQALSKRSRLVVRPSTAGTSRA